MKKNFYVYIGFILLLINIVNGTIFSLYSYIRQRYVGAGSTSVELAGWGNAKTSSFNRGYHRIEIWLDDRIQFSDTFYIY